MAETYLGCPVIRVGGEIYTRTMYVLPVCLVPLTYILRTCSLGLYLAMASQLLQQCDIRYEGSIDKEGQSRSRTLSCMADGNGEY